VHAALVWGAGLCRFCLGRCQCRGHLMISVLALTPVTGNVGAVSSSRTSPSVRLGVARRQHRLPRAVGPADQGGQEPRRLMRGVLPPGAPGLAGGAGQRIPLRLAVQRCGLSRTYACLVMTGCSWFLLLHSLTRARSQHRAMCHPPPPGHRSERGRVSLARRPGPAVPRQPSTPRRRARGARRRRTGTRQQACGISRDACQGFSQPPKEGRGKGVSTPLHSQSIAHMGACGKIRVMPHNGWPGAQSGEMEIAKCVCCRRRPDRGDVKPRAGLAVR
jgi:hypothetical protein